MNIQCDCGKFKAILHNLPNSSPGRLVCYCDDCKKYATRLNREDILDCYGGTQVVPVYPNDYEISHGREYLHCNLLSMKGLHRWSVSCCHTPVGNTLPRFPWVGIPHKVFTNAAPDSLENLGQIRSRIRGKGINTATPFTVSDRMTFRDAKVVIPFIVKGYLFRKYNKSPFFHCDGVTPVIKAEILGP